MQNPIPVVEIGRDPELEVAEIEDGYCEFRCNGRLVGTIERDPRDGRWLFRCDHAMSIEHIAFIRGVMLGLLGIKVP